MDNTIKVGFVLPDLSNGGAEKALYNVAAFFYRKNINTQIIVGSKSGANLDKLPADFKVFSLQNNTSLDKPSFYKNIKGLIKYAKAEQPDVLICNSDYLNIAAIISRIFVKKKFKIIVSQQYHAESFLGTLPKKNRLFLKLIQRKVARKADIIVGSSIGVAKNYAELYGIKYPSAKVQSIYNPIYDDSIPELAKQPVNDEAFNIDALKLITVGRLLEQKDHPTLIKAFTIFSKSNTDAHLFIIGVGKDQQMLESLANELSVSNKISFLGYKENPFAYVAKCDLFVLSSKYEGFGNVIVEAMATGVNVASTDCPSGPAEILNDGEFGFLCPVGNPQFLADAIATALNNKKPAEVLINRAKDFSIEKIGQQYLDAALELYV